MNADTLIFRLMHAACILKGMCGNEPDKRDPAMVRDWDKVQAILDEADSWVRSTPDEDQTLPCEECGEEVRPDEHCGNDREDGTSEYLCPDCYDPDTDDGEDDTECLDAWNAQEDVTSEPDTTVEDFFSGELDPSVNLLDDEPDTTND